MAVGTRGQFFISFSQMMHDMVSSEDEWEEESSHNRSLPTAQIEPREMTRQQSNVSHASAVSHPFVPHPHPHHQHVEVFPFPPPTPLLRQSNKVQKQKLFSPFVPFFKLFLQSPPSFAASYMGPSGNPPVQIHPFGVFSGFLAQNTQTTQFFDTHHTPTTPEGIFWVFIFAYFPSPPFYSYFLRIFG